jgi:hypothetical protein
MAIRLKRSKNLPQTGFPSLQSPKSDRLLGRADRFIDRGSREALLAECALDEASILRSIRARLRGSCALQQAAPNPSSPLTMRAATH